MKDSKLSKFFKTLQNLAVGRFVFLFEVRDADLGDNSLIQFRVLSPVSHGPV